MSDDPPITFPTPFQHMFLQPQNDRPPTPTSMTTFSLTSTMDTRIFREDNGRRFQASNDDYALPADEEEGAPLNIQHRGWKMANNGKNYLAPMEQVLVNEGEGKRVIDLGTGTGIWAEEMAVEFPKAEVVGLDLVPYEKDPTTLPANLDLVLGDFSKGVAYPDAYFDVVYARLITAGVRDWKGLVDEAVRICKPGGLVVFAETNCSWDLIDPVEEAPGSGFIKFMALAKEKVVHRYQTPQWYADHDRACVMRGLASNAGDETLPSLMGNHPMLKDFKQAFVHLPLHPWSDDPGQRQAGAIMVDDAKLIPETLRLLIMDGCGVPSDQYERVKENYIADLHDKRVHSAIPMWHNYAWRV